MSIASKYNKTGKIYNYEMPADAPFKDLRGLYTANDKNSIYPVHGFYINTKSKFGDTPTALSEKFYINLPAHMLDTVKEIMADDEATDQINAGGLGIMIRPYEKEMSNRGKTWTETFYSVEFVDL